MKRQKISIINETNEPTKKLRELVKIVANHIGISDNIEIRFVKGRSSHACGRAYIGTVIYNNSNTKKRDTLGWHHSVTKLTLCKNWKTEKLENTLRVLEHEFDHTLGLQHRDMMPIHKIDVSDYIDEVKKVIS